MPLYEPIMQYHVKGSDDEEEECLLSDQLQSKKNLITDGRQSDENIHLYNIENPLTIIQLKDPEKNLDSDIGILNSSRIGFFLTFFLIAFAFIIYLFWNLSCSNCINQTQFRPKESIDEWSIIFQDLVFSCGLNAITTSLIVSCYQEQSENQAISYGLIGISIEIGQEIWKRQIPTIITQHNCQLLDINNDNCNDCIFIGKKGLFIAINSLTGEEIWHLQHHIPLTNFSLPRRLPDLDGDSVSELIVMAAVTLPSGVRDENVHIRRNLILISGKHGTVIGRPYLLVECNDIGNFNVTYSLELQFDCISTINTNQYEMSLEEFYYKVTGYDLPTNNYRNNYNQLVPFETDPLETIRDSIHLDWILENKDCRECGVTVKIWDDFAHRVLWNQTWKNAVAFAPLSTRYNTERMDSPIEAFVFRLWKWSHPGNLFEEKANLEMNKMNSNSELHFRHSRHFIVSESVFYVTLNHTIPKFIQILSSSLRQKCVFMSKLQIYSCTPHFDTHPNSMILVESKTLSDIRYLIIASTTLTSFGKLETTLRKLYLSVHIESMKIY